MMRSRFGLWHYLVVALGLSLAACNPASVPETADLPTLAALPSVTLTPTSTITLTVTASLTPTITLTSQPSETATFTVTPSATITETATPTATNTPLPTDTAEPTVDNEGVSALVQLALNATILPQTVQPVPAAVTPVGVATTAATSCPFPPSGGFGVVYLNDPTLTQQIGCPVGNPPLTASVASASQVYERGEMFWLAGPPGVIYVLFNTGRFQRYDDTYNSASDPISGGETPPSGLLEPIRGFGKVWRSFPDVRNGLGWALQEESGGQATTQQFDRGVMLHLPQRGLIIILVNDAGGLSGGWRSLSGSF
jgi:hypothetical protein